MSEELIRLSDLTMTFEDGETILDHINLYIRNKEFLTLLGPSGCGKTTTLRIIGGFLTPTSGDVFFNGQRVNDVPPYKRKINTVFQKYALFPHLDVYDNIAFGLRLLKLSEQEIDDRVTEMLEIVSLKGFENRKVTSLSGGQQQRVAIARALATNPKVLLCDEATSALDPKTTNAILELIREINQKLGITVIIITHQMSVVEEICSHVAILDSGSVVEEGIMSEVSAVFSHPKSEAARRLVFPEGNPESLLCSLPGSRLIRVVFNGADATGKPIIARMATEIGVEANIAYASTRSIEGRTYGSMLLSIEDKNDNLARAIGYLTQDGDITAQEVTQYAE